MVLPNESAVLLTDYICISGLFVQKEDWFFLSCFGARKIGEDKFFREKRENENRYGCRVNDLEVRCYQR